MASNVQKLQQAGILKTPHGLEPHEEAAIESLSEDEVATWTSIKGKLDTAGVQATASAKIFI